MRSVSLVCALASLAVLGTGCPHTDPLCSTDPRPSVGLIVLDENGEGLDDATVTFFLDGEGPMQAEESSPGEFLMGLDDVGTFEITVNADGYETMMLEYEVMDGGECGHVMIIQEAIMLTPSP